jgi:Fe-S-cluster containining protein
MEATVRRFACTACGKCCDRSPEVELGEAAALADVFVFRLMFRLHWLPKRLKDYLAQGIGGPAGSKIYYDKKRLLSTFAARDWIVKSRREGRTTEHFKFLLISALPLASRPSECSALVGNKCGIYDRRPLSCRSVPFHYSRSEATAETDLAAFVATSGYLCDTGEGAPAVLEDGLIIAPQYKAAREAAMVVAREDKPWAEAIARRLRSPDPRYPSFPTLDDVEANASIAAVTVSMRFAWQIAADAGLMSRNESNRLIGVQLDTIGRVLRSELSPADRETLTEMVTEYRRCLQS